MIQEIDFSICACTVHAVDRVSPKVVVLSLVPFRSFRFQPGQYISILAKDGRWRSFSVANAPNQQNILQLHIAHVQENEFSDYVFRALRVGDIINIRGPLGMPFYPEKSKPIIFIAGGTGFALIKSIIEHTQKTQGLQRTLFYWGVHSLADLYMPHLPRMWQIDQPNFKFVPVLSKPNATDDWQGRTGYVHQAVIEDFSDLSSYAVYACGPLGMVSAAFDAFIKLGLKEETFFAQGFSSYRVPPTPVSKPWRAGVENHNCSSS